MARFDVRTTDGWSGIDEALRGASRGDTVFIAAGLYEGATTLGVPSGVTLEGEPGTLLAFQGDEVAISIRNATDVSLRGIAIEGYRQFAPDIDDADPDLLALFGLVHAANSSRVRIRAVAVKAFARRRSCISASTSEAIDISSCTLSGARRGVSFNGTSGEIVGTTASHCFYGIALVPDDQKRKSTAVIRGNECHDNKFAGIGLFSSESTDVSDNTCRRSDVYGVVLARGDKTVDEPSRARLVGNRCSENGSAGIALFSSESERVSDNICCNNGHSGILLKRADYSRAAASGARLIGNTCNHNAQAGIVLFSSESEELSGNTCCSNLLSGIILQRDPTNPEATSRARIAGNICRENKKAGITLLSAESDELTGNTCSSNGTKGISLARDSLSEGSPSRARLTANVCDANGSCGIELTSSESDDLSGNRCSNNGASGILLQRALTVLNEPSRACVTGNSCVGNKASGIRLISCESSNLSDNNCSDNLQNGIELQRDSACPDAPSRARITGNACHKNQQSGISLYSSDSDEISGNTCFANLRSGIALQRDSDSSKDPSRARVQDNLCHHNQQSGIILYSSESDEISGNTCSANLYSGIVLQRAVGPDAPSRAAITGNVSCLNGQGGIVLSSSESESIGGNACWGNKGPGIALQRNLETPHASARARIVGNTCHENEDSGISLNSSDSDDLSSNACWSNGGSGIRLGRDEAISDAPSRARITGNICHQNKVSGISLRSSMSVDLSANICWGNGGPGIGLSRDSVSPGAPSRARITANFSMEHANVGILLDSSESNELSGNMCWDNRYSGIQVSSNAKYPDDPPRAYVIGNLLQENLRGIVVSGGTGTYSRNRLWANTHESSFDFPSDLVDCVAENNRLDPSLNLPAAGDDELQRRLRTALEPDAPRNVTHRLASFLAHGASGGFEALFEAMRPEPSNAPAQNPDTSNPVWSATWSENKRRVEPTLIEGGAATIGLTFAQLSMSVSQGDASQVRWTALVAPAESAVQDLSKLLEKFSATHNGMRKRNDPARIAPIVQIDRSKGEELSKDASESVYENFLEEEALAGANKWAERFGCLARSWLAWASFMVIGFGVWAPGANEFLKAWPDESLEFVTRVFQVAIFLALTLSILTATINLTLPSVLQIRLPGWALLVDRMVKSGFLSRKDPAKLLSDDWIARRRRGASVAWVHRRFFRKGDIAPLIIRHVTRWSDEELLRLKELARRLKPSQGLFVVIQLDDRAYLRPSVLDIDDVRRPWGTRIDLNFLDDRDQVSVMQAGNEDGSAVRDLLGGRDEKVSARIVAAIRHRDWTCLELLAGLPLGSAPAGRFSIRRSMARLAEHDVRLREDMQVYASFFVPDGVTPPSPNHETLNALFEAGEQAVALGHAGSGDVVRLWGKVGYRRKVAQIIRQLFPPSDGASADTYIAASVASGIWRILGDVCESIERYADANDPDIREYLASVAIRGLEAIAFLGAELHELCKTSNTLNLGALEPRWERLDASLSKSTSASFGTAIALRYVVALSACNRTPVSGVWSSQQLLQAINAGDQSILDSGLLSPGIALAADFSFTLNRLKNLNHSTAQDTIDRMVRQKWAGLPPELIKGLRERASIISEQTLPSLLARASSLAELERVARLHARQPLLVIHAIALIAGQIAWPWPQRVLGGDEEKPTEALFKIADMLRLTLSSPAFVPEDSYISSGSVPDFATSIFSPSLYAIRLMRLGTHDAKGVAELMSRQAPHILLTQWLEIDPVQPPIDRVIDLELDRVLALAEVY